MDIIDEKTTSCSSRDWISTVSRSHGITLHKEPVVSMNRNAVEFEMQTADWDTRLYPLNSALSVRC